MTPEELKKVEDSITQQVVGRQAEVAKVLEALSRKTGRPANIILTGSPGTGKTAIFKELAEKLATDRKDMSGRLEELGVAITFAPLSPEQIGQLVMRMVDKNEKIPAERKEEAKAIMQEVIAQDGGYDATKGMRSLRPVLRAIAEVSSAPDMREALAKKYPHYIYRDSIKSGEHLADAFTNGTASSTRALKPYRLKSKPGSGRVGFLSLN